MIVCTQIPNEKETIDILKFKPDRLGHCTCIHPSLQGSEQLFDMLLQSKVPVGKEFLIGTHCDNEVIFFFIILNGKL